MAEARPPRTAKPCPRMSDSTAPAIRPEPCFFLRNDPMQQRSLGPFQVSAIGLGCMNLNHAYGVAPSEEEAARLLLRALDLGITHFDTAALYGFGDNETLIGKTLAQHRSRFTLASKCGMTGVAGPDGVKRRVIDGRPEVIKRTCEEALQRLQ